MQLRSPQCNRAACVQLCGRWCVPAACGCCLPTHQRPQHRPCVHCICHRPVTTSSNQHQIPLPAHNPHLQTHSTPLPAVVAPHPVLPHHPDPSCAALCHPPPCRYGLLSTVSAKGDSQGFPSGSVVEFAVDGSGQPLLSLSTLSSHTRDLQTDGRCSLTVMTPGFKVRGCVGGWLVWGGMEQPGTWGWVHL
jgi:hypothetical protein